MKTNNPFIQQSINPSAVAVRLFASSNSWIEGEALRQLYAVAKFEGMRLTVGFPDLHPGKGSPVGAAFVTEGLIYPYLIEGDIGCGMALFKTDLVQRDIKLNRWADLRFDLEHPWDGDVQEVLAASDLEFTEFDRALGTLGGGNHFAELQMVDEVLDARAFKLFGLGKQQLVVLVHSGSRALGESVLRDYVAEHQASGSDAETFAAAAYLKGHDLAVRWAKVNRELLARRFVQQLGAEADLLWDGCHNSITSCEHEGETVWVHRKGAVIAESEPVVIPGSRGSLSYLVKPLGDGESRAWSLAHGAGRKWARSEARVRMRERFGKDQLVQTSLGSRVICGERHLLYEEAPAAYKNIEVVIEDLVDAGLVSIIATFRPLLTYKTR
ncbi:MAG TPA: RNA ligase RtcB family protein [Candidatus Dormibacteraeota bacterium]|nr:RNA ligase RtcB family protein [Candidatus Dormibacteraeota bacterium]